MKAKDYENLAEAVARALPISEDLIRKNVRQCLSGHRHPFQTLEKKTRTKGDLEALRQAVSAAQNTTGAAPTGGPTMKKNVEQRLHNLLLPGQRMP